MYWGLAHDHGVFGLGENLDEDGYGVLVAPLSLRHGSLNKLVVRLRLIFVYRQSFAFINGKQN